MLRLFSCPIGCVSSVALCSLAWLELDEGNPGFQLLIFLQFSGKGSTVIFFSFIFFSTTYIIKFSIYLFSKFFMAVSCFINSDDIFPRQVNPD
jgi:hypothetical protein